MLYIAIDSGITNTRVWLMRDDEVLAQQSEAIGVRESAIKRSNHRYSERVSALIQGLLSHVATTEQPKFVLASGMITSALGLHEVKHLRAPVGMMDLSERVELKRFPEVCDMPFLLVPGVRSGRELCNLDTVSEIDIIRGEETELFGTIKSLAIEGPMLYIHPGSHTKVILVDEHERIVNGMSMLTGEFIYAIQTRTVLSSCLPRGRLGDPDEYFVLKGADHCRESGLLLTLFCVRILEQFGNYGKGQLFSFLVGAIVEEELKSLMVRSVLKGSERQIVLGGYLNLRKVWQILLENRGYEVVTLSAEQVEAAYLSGLREIVFNSPVFKELVSSQNNTKLTS